MLRDSVARFARQHGGVEQRRRSSTTDLGFASGNWQQFASQGWLGAIFAEEAESMENAVGEAGARTTPWIADLGGDRANQRDAG